VAGSTKHPDAPVDASGLRFAIVVSRFHEDITRRLLEGAREAFSRCKVADEGVFATWVPGAFELPLACRTLARTGRFDAVVALGCVIRGDTPHFDYVAGECARGLMAAMLETDVPMAFGVLTTDDVAQAEARAGGESNKGYDAAMTAAETALSLRELR
jgi:6,7-dimethyl-8-ribityllumazine synthase